MRVGETIVAVELDADDVRGWQWAQVTIRDPAGEVVGDGPAWPVPPSPTGPQTVPVGVTPATAGIHTRIVTLVRTTPTAATGYLVDARFVVEPAVSVGHSLASAREDWRDAPRSDLVLWDLLATARRQVVSFAPIGTARDVLDGAQLQQARNLRRGMTVGQGGELADGGGEYTITVFPLDWQIKARLRPESPGSAADAMGPASEEVTAP